METLLRFARAVRTTIGGERIWVSVRPLYWKGISALAGDRGFRLRLTDGHAYRLEPQFYAWQIDRYEPGVVQLLTNAVKPDSVVYDIGAHVGLISLMCARLIDPASGRVYAFEPAQSNYALLCRHIVNNGFADRVVASCTLIGDRVAEAIPFVNRPEQFTANSLAYAIDGGQTTPTPMTTVDRLVGDGTPPPGVLKIDVEGFEAAVLRGATTTLRNHRPLVVCAMHPEPLAQLGERASAIVDFMKHHGYDAFDLDGEPAQDPGPEEIVFRPRRNG